MNSVRFLLLPLLLLFAASSSAQITTANLLTSTTNKLVRPTEFGTNLIAQPDAVSARNLLGVSAGSSFTNANLVGGTVTGMTNSDLTASRVMVSGATGIPTNGSVTSATLLFLDATSSVQTQLDAKAPLASPTFTGTITGNGAGLTNLSAGSLLNLYAEGPRSGTAPAATNFNSVAIGDGATTSTATNAFAFGHDASATGNSSTAFGEASQASGNHSAAFGWDARATVAAAYAVGYSVRASASGSLATGLQSNAGLYGKHAHAAGHFTSHGDAQTGVMVAALITTGASSTNLGIAGGAVFLPNNTTWSFHVRVIARRTDATGENMDWTFDGIISRDANAASTALVGDVVVSPRTGVTTAWDCTVTANATDGSLQINVTGEAAKTIRWVARIETVEVSN